eukprot:COSAG02_NODE_9539_length_2186_cov_1.737422_2_plen_69_part_00
MMMTSKLSEVVALAADDTERTVVCAGNTVRAVADLGKYLGARTANAPHCTELRSRYIAAAGRPHPACT